MTWVVPIKRTLLTDEQRQSIHAGALKILERIGIEIDSELLRDRLAAFAGVRLAGRRACFDGDLVERLLQRPAPQPWQAPERRRISLGSGDGLFHIVDVESDAIRPMTWVDAVASTRLVDAMHAVDVVGSCPGTPQDIPPEMFALAEFVIGALYSRSGGTFVSPWSHRVFEYLLAMHEVMGQEFALSLYVLSPLRLVGESVDTLLRFLPRIRCFSVSSMPMIGATAPIHIPAAFMQSLAESFGGLATIRLLRPDAEVHFDGSIFPMDMKVGSMVYSSPEMNLWDMMRLEMAAFYGQSTLGGRFIRTMAKRPGVQAAAEKAASAVAGVLAGARHFNGAGKLSLDEVFSAEMLVIDREIADYAERFAWGVDLGPEAFDISVVEEGVAGGSFIGLESTVSRFRQNYWMPRLMERRMLAAWMAEGEDSMRARARAEVRRWLGEYAFELDPGRTRALRDVYAQAAQDLVGGTGLPPGRTAP